MPSTISRPCGTRLHFEDIEALERVARERQMTLSSVLAMFAREGLRKTTATA
jgi:hypothetical protein